MNRNLSIDQHWNRIAAQHTPEHRFAGSTASDWNSWRDALLPKVQQTLGRMPEKPPLNPEIVAEWRADGLIKQKILIDVEEGLTAPILVFRPENVSSKTPAILACHGHGPGGKDPIMGNLHFTDNTGKPNPQNSYGLEMAKQGFVTIAIDWRGFGERDDRLKPLYHDITHGRDLCNVHYLRANVLGMTMLGLNIHDASCALDYLCQLPYVDTQNIGVMGLSFGGTMATWIAICDERIKATDIICYSDRFADFGMRDVNFCGSQITPNIFSLCDVPDLHGLIAPRPLLIEIGAYDRCFHVESAMSCYQELQKIYQAAQCPEQLKLDLFNGPHEWGANLAGDFFKKALNFKHSG